MVDLNQKELYILVRIKRSTGFSGFLARIKIYVDDEQVATIKQNQQIEVELPTDEAIISVSQAGVNSNELVVKEGQVVEITNSSWWHISFISLIIAMFFMGLLLPFDYRIFGYIIFLIISIAINYFIEGFELKVIYP